MWPYQIEKFSDQPSADCYKNGLTHLIKLYSRVPRSLNSMKGCLADGFPFVFGFTVYESFEGEAVAKTGVVPMPTGKEAVVGGHAVLAVGYIDSEQMFIVRNSWGPKWGIKGYFKMPYAYLTDADLADDFWTVRLTV
jgi:C1A family cysteine protease